MQRLIFTLAAAVAAAPTALFAAPAPDSSTTYDWIKQGDKTGAEAGFSVGPAGDVNGDGFSDVIVGAPLYDAGAGNSAGRVWVFHGTKNGTKNNHSWLFTSDEAGAKAGTSCLTAGDVNGDGYSDVIIGQPDYDGAGSNRGQVRVYYGSATGIEDVGVTILNGAGDGDEFGRSVGTAGDVNGDGFSDVFVSWDQPSDDGKVSVFHGSASGLSTVAAWTQSGPKNFGLGCGTAGDVNADGYADLIVGARGKIVGTAANTGKAFVYHGSSSGLEATESFSIEGAQGESDFGHSVATAGDVNGDGYADVVVGAPRHGNNEEGRVWIYPGGPGGVSTPQLWNRTGTINDGNFGYSVFTAGDFNGDGYADVAIGAPERGLLLSGGRVFVFFGSPSGPGSNPDWEYDYPGQLSDVGHQVATAGDVNGDGYSDIIIGAPKHTQGEIEEGAAYIFHGCTDGPAENTGWTFDGAQNDEHLGTSVALAGDVNGDGFEDVLVGAPDYANGQNKEGRALLFSGTVDGLSATPSWEVEGNQANGNFGRSVASAGDVNGDGYDDVVVGMPKASFSSNGQARVRLFLGSATGPSTTPDWEVSASGSQQLGSTVGTFGDINGDGYGDFYAAGDDVQVFFGSSQGPGPTPDQILQASPDFLLAAYAGDVNRDGYSDVLLARPRTSFQGGFVDGGRVELRYGSPTGLSTTADWFTESTSTVWFGWDERQIGTAGDVNGDGYSDIIIGSHSEADMGVTVGKAFVYHGGPNGPASSADWTAAGSVLSGQFGAAVGTAGDVNGDGYSDVLIGSPSYEDPTDREGAAFVYLGSASGLASEPVWQGESDDLVAFYGRSVSTAGDVNGDGFADIVIGAADFNADQTDDGQAFLYYGNKGPGISRELRPRQTNDSAPIPWMGASDNDGIRLKGRLLSPFGKGMVGYEIETKPLGTAYDFTNTTITNFFQSGLNFNKKAEGLAFGVTHRWRARPMYDLVDFPFQARGPWTSPARAGSSEATFRTPTCAATASASNYGSGRAGTNGVPTLTSGDPVLGETVTISIGNGLPGSAVLFYGFASASSPFDGGTLALVPAGILTLPLNAQGALDLPLHLDANPGLCGVTVYMQIMFADPGVQSFYHTAQSKGLAWTLGS